MCTNEQTLQHIVDGHYPYALDANVPIGTSLIIGDYELPCVNGHKNPLTIINLSFYKCSACGVAE